MIFRDFEGRSSFMNVSGELCVNTHKSQKLPHREDFIKVPTPKKLKKNRKKEMTKRRKKKE